jgi:hypothetical protein
MQESPFQPGTIGPPTRNGERALGIAQFMPRTAMGFNIQITDDQRQGQPTDCISIDGALSAITAVAFTLARMLFATSSVVGTNADIIRRKAGIPYVTSVASFLPVNAIEPAW